MHGSDLSFITAQPDDVGRVLALVRARAEWIRDNGSRQWQIFLTESAETFVAQLIATGRTRIVMRAGRDVGTLRLDWTDERFWGEAGNDGRAGYVHTLATHREFAGQRLVAHMLQWACDRIVEAGRDLLRIDCDATNAKLIAYYRSFGFEPREVVPMESIMPGYRSQQLERSARERVV